MLSRLLQFAKIKESTSPPPPSPNLLTFTSTITTKDYLADTYLLKVNNRNTRTRSFWCLYWQIWTYFTPCFSVPIVNFEYVFVGWVEINQNGFLSSHPFLTISGRTIKQNDIPVLLCIERERKRLAYQNTRQFIISV